MNSKNLPFAALLVGALFSGALHAQVVTQNSVPATTEKVISAGDITYRGNFVVDASGALNGIGRIEWRNGNVYEGPVTNNQLTGVGKFFWSNGDRYEGDLVNAEPHGQGTYFYKNGDRYVGPWQRGQKHGQARYTYADGSYWEGQYVNDQQMNGRLQNVPGWAAGSRARKMESSVTETLK